MTIEHLAKQTLRVLELQAEYFQSRSKPKLAEWWAAERRLRAACLEVLNLGDVPEAEQLIYPPTVYAWHDGATEAREEPYDLYHDTVKNKRVGSRLVHEYAAPGRGYISYEITRIDETGVYGRVLENTLRQLELEDVR